ncbi:hypothetical protein RI129_002291 [Pyrocoelia pectoralis]|uniref:Uncharacterized protein n=1 Tax=Pyrocoelia pectoralis TaxID=417401 RepID=A0AAN7VNJ3_9COLE
MMKFYLILISVCFISVDAKISEYAISRWGSLISPYNEGCIKDSGANPDDVNELLTAKFPYTKPIRDYILCIYLKLEMILPNGEFQECLTLKKGDYLTYKLLRKCIEEAKYEMDLSMKSSIFCYCILSGLREESC